MNNVIGALQHVWAGGREQGAQTAVDHAAQFLHFLKP
jgi:hypothetical protein